MEYRQSFAYQMTGPALLSLVLFVMLLASISGFIVSSLVMCIHYLQWKRFRVLMQEDRIIIEKGFFTLSREQVGVSKIEKVRLTRSLSQRLFKTVGTIVLETGNDLMIELSNIENCQQLHGELEKLAAGGRT